MLKFKKKGLLIVISSPSGAGKTTITNKLINKKKNKLNLSVSLTTRKPRSREVNGIHYKFVSEDYFQNQIRKDTFLEYAKVFGNYYGTLKSEVYRKVNKGINIILDIDWQGARLIREKVPNNVLSIFILPPSLNELRNRLKKRGHDNFFVNKRMAKAKEEIKHWHEYDYVLVNNKIDFCVQQIEKIISVHQMSPMKQYIKKF